MPLDISSHESSLSAERAETFSKWLQETWEGVRPSSILDVGCRCGAAMTAFIDTLPSSIRVAGVDLLPEAVARANNVSEAYEGNILNLPFHAKEFDWAFCSHTLEHIYPTDLSQAISELLRVTSYGICIVVPLESAEKFETYKKRTSPDGEAGMHKFHEMNPLVWLDSFRSFNIILLHANLSLDHSDLYFIFVHRDKISYGGRVYAPVCD